MKLALISNTTNEVLNVWQAEGDEKEIPLRHTLPNGKQISPITRGWSGGDYSVVEVKETEVPKGKATKGPPTYEVVKGEVVETYTVETYRPMIRKSTIQTRLIAAGKMDDAYAALIKFPVAFARWFAPDQPRVYCDDADSIAFLEALGLDPAVFLKEGDE